MTIDLERIKMEPDFSGYVSKANIQCTDGRTIMPGAFKHQDGLKVPLVYQHNHTDANQVLGYAILSDKEDGTWGDVFINKDNPTALTALSNVRHGALDKFSVWAKDLVERGAMVHSGNIQEVSLVLAGANSGASIYNVLTHGDVDGDDLMIVGGEIVHADGGDKPAVEEKPAEKPVEEKSVADVLETLSDEQELAVNAFIDDIVKEAVTEAVTKAAEIEHDNLTKETQMINAFEGGQPVGGVATLPQLKHADIQSILATAKGGDIGNLTDNAVGSLRELVRSTKGQELMHAADYGIENIEVLFPDAQNVTGRPTWVDRRQDWVKVWMAGTGHQPFSRIKTMYADITADEARARGYIKANEKVDEVFPVFKRTTGPAWVYKKQKLDRQDIIDIVDFDVVAWMKAEMRGKLDEEVARAGLFGDGRPTMIGADLNPDKIQDPGANNNSGDGIRAVVNDHELYATSYFVPMDADASGDDWNTLLDAVTEAGEFYRGSGNKTAFMSFRTATKMLTMRSNFDQKRIYRNLDEVAGDMDVARIQRVPTELFPTDVLCIVLDMADYTYGTNKGGEVTLFDDFDIKVNQYHYLMETYLSGTLILPYAAQIFKRVDTTDTLVVPTAPTFVASTGVVTIPTVTGVTYTNAATGATLIAGAQAALAAGASITVEAIPEDDTYYFTTNDDRVDSWTFTRDEA
jgi:HK97 family phage prohead protease